MQVTSTASPETIHDFGGFPPELYRLQRGLDHGVWVPLRYLIPDAHVPVLQVSMPQELSAAGAFGLGQGLSGLREQGVMVMGSGSLTHNPIEGGMTYGILSMESYGFGFAPGGIGV